jgi:hypothetical protein
VRQEENFPGGCPAHLCQNILFLRHAGIVPLRYRLFNRIFKGGAAQSLAMTMFVL